MQELHWNYSVSVYIITLGGKLSADLQTIWDNFEWVSNWNVFITFGLKILVFPFLFYLDLFYSLTLENELSDIESSLEVSNCLS